MRPLWRRFHRKHLIVVGSRALLADKLSDVMRYSRARLYHTRVFRIIAYIKQSKHPLQNHMLQYRSVVFLYPTATAGTLDVAKEAPLPVAFPAIRLRHWRAHCSRCVAGTLPSQHIHGKICGERTVVKKRKTMNHKKKKKWRISKTRGRARVRVGKVGSACCRNGSLRFFLEHCWCCAIP